MKAIITSLSPVAGERVSIVEDMDPITFYARVSGTAAGACGGGNVVTSIKFEES